MSFGGVVFLSAAMIGAAIIMYVLEPRRVKLAAAEPLAEVPAAKNEAAPDLAPSSQPETAVKPEDPVKLAQPAADLAAASNGKVDAETLAA